VEGLGFCRSSLDSFSPRYFTYYPLQRSVQGQTENRFLKNSGYQSEFSRKYVIYRGRRYGIECKFSETRKITKSMNRALESLNLAHHWVIYPGEHTYPPFKADIRLAYEEYCHPTEAVSLSVEGLIIDSLKMKR
jgi:hypothetical protein